MFEPHLILSLAGRIALVTGAGSGIGRASALALASAGATVVGLDVSQSGLQGTVAASAGLPGGVAGAEVDVSDHAAVQAAAAGRQFDVLVAAAGITIRKGLDQTSPEDWARVIDVNLTGYFNALKAVVPAMPDGGSIVLIASMTAHVGYRYPAYSASKGAILALTRQLARELGPRRIRVNSVSPGVIVTGITREHFSNPDVSGPTVAQTPLGRLGEPDDIAKAVLFLASDQASFVTGADLLVDGGITSTAHV